MEIVKRIVVRESEFNGEPEKDALWSMFDPPFIPNVNDTVEHWCDPLDIAQWSPVALKDNQAHNHRCWKVIHIHHEYHRVAIDKMMHTAFVYVEETQKKE